MVPTIYRHFKCINLFNNHRMRKDVLLPYPFNKRDY